MLAGEGEFGVHKVGMRVTIRPGLEVAEVTDVAHRGIWRRMIVTGWVEVTAGGGEVGRGEIAFFVHVKTMFARREAVHIGHDAHAMLGLFEGDGATHAGIVAGDEHGDGFEAHRGHGGVVIVMTVAVGFGLDRGGERDEERGGGRGVAKGGGEG